MNWKRYEQHAPDWSRRIEKADAPRRWRVIFDGHVYPHNSPPFSSRREARGYIKILKSLDASPATRRLRLSTP